MAQATTDNTKFHSRLDAMSAKTLPIANDRNSTRIGISKGFWSAVEKSQDGFQAGLNPGARMTLSEFSFFLSRLCPHCTGFILLLHLTAL